MSANERLLAEYIAEHQSGGEADPRAYLERAVEVDRLELAALIDGYLARAPRAKFDAGDYENSAASATANDIGRSFRGLSGLWPALLPRLRAQAGLDQDKLAHRLAAELGAPGNERKVAAYYDQMEHGTLPAAGVSDQVLETLGAIVNRNPAKLREAGMIGSDPQSTTEPDADWDETDTLFNGR